MIENIAGFFSWVLCAGPPIAAMGFLQFVLLRALWYTFVKRHAPGWQDTQGTSPMDS
jgi:hypothetical protein